ncbi:hypothetical protein CF15_03235 [Pyrodictium occultum]|uniref:Thiamine biosynthesis protein ThiS n=1 Tax=Pyrodictium occultum TaxID=2309 RepID=A0A0V8RUT5_PYROC|nr:MoaD/ThiS family protein [Pyrodictium occultum]KSW11828.1 hypothetical protein CF15_03235 [Pyrodictium occultum]
MGIKVSALILPERQAVEVELTAGTVRELVHRLGYSAEDVVVLRDGRPLLEEDRLEDGDNVTILRAASGG